MLAVVDGLVQQHRDVVVVPAIDDVLLMNQLAITRPGGGRPRTRPGRVLGDKAYSSTAIRAHLRRRGIKATIPQRSGQISHRRRRGSRAGRPPVFDPAACKDRNTVERAFNQLRQHGAVATRTANATSSGAAPSTSPPSKSGSATHHMI
jgi:transposase